VTEPDYDLEGFVDETLLEAGANLRLLEDAAAFVRKYVALPSEHALVAVVLWAAHAHAIDAAESTPRLALISAEKQSGKTRCLEVLELLVPIPRHAVNMTAAALFRAVDADQPTLLFDEADTYFGPRAAREHDELRGLVNAGHRRGAVAYRVVGQGADMTVRAYPAFAAVALAGIGDLPDTILDRAVLVRMRRRAPDEHVEPFRLRRARPEGEALRERLATWASANLERLCEADPPMPAGLADRAADVWEPLLAIADAFGGNWPKRARAAAIALNAERAAADPSLGVHLLADIREIYSASNVARFSSEDLVRCLTGLDESPWGDLHGKALDARSLARRLRPFEIRPRKLRIGDDTFRGYELADFDDAWRRYLSSSEEGEQAEQAEHKAANQAGAPEHERDPESTTPRLTCDVPDVPRVPVFRETRGGPSARVPHGGDAKGNGSGTRVPSLDTTAMTPDTAQAVAATDNCPICGAPPPRRGSFGLLACDHQLAAFDRKATS
jgi:hypothetical protein